MTIPTILYFLIGLLLIAFLFLIVTIRLSQRLEQKGTIKVSHKATANFYVKSFYFFCRFKWTRKYLYKIRKRIEMMDLSDNWSINRKTMQFAYLTFGLCSLLFIFVLSINHRLYFILISMLTLYVIHNQLLLLLIDRLDDKLLQQLESFLGDVRHYYHEHGMIDEAIYDSIDACDYEISQHAVKMYEILTSEDIDEQMAHYYDLIPNKYFNTFLALSYTVQKFGDKVVDGKSMFLTNLNYLKQEINLEMLRRRKLSYLFKSLSMIAITPIFFLSVIEDWAKSNLPELKIYYEGPYGFFVQIGLFLTVVICFELISKMQSHQEYVPITDRFGKKLLKIKWVKKLVHRQLSHQYSKAMKINDLIKMTGTKLSLEGFYIKRIAYGTIGFFLTFLVIGYGHHLAKHNLLYMSNALLTEDQAINNTSETDLISLDRGYILKFKGKNASYQIVENALLQDSKINNRLVAQHAKRILGKIRSFDQHYFKWWEFLLCILAGTGFYWMPYGLLVFKKNIMYLNMEDEVMQFHTIILMLMHIERISVEDLLKWMSVFAIIFKESIEKCLNNFEQGDYQALEQLKMDEPFLPFVRIIENLQAATDRIFIVQAFDELKIERDYYQDKRKQDNEIIVNKKGIWGKVIAFVPLTGTVFLYLITPFIHLSITQFMNYSIQIKNYL